MAEKEIKTQMAKSEYYRGNNIVETLQFVVPPKDNPHVRGYVLSGREYVQDHFNIANELAEIEWEVLNAYEECNDSSFTYDEKKLQKDLAEFVAMRDKEDKMSWISFTINSIKGAKNGLMSERLYAYTKYIHNLLVEKQKGNEGDMDAVKTPGLHSGRLRPHAFSADSAIGK